VDHRSIERNSQESPPFTHRTVGANGIEIHFVEAGEGPLVLLLHGFPEGWYSWRHQLRALADAGFHAVAPDQRGYGRTDCPVEISRYSMFHLVGDVVGLIRELGEEAAVVIGHDWGANVAWNTALFRPDLVRAVAGLSVPLRPRVSRPPLDIYRESAGPGFYQLYFQQPGIAEREFERDVRRTVLAFLCSESGDASRVPDLMVGESGLIDTLEILDPLPRWLTEEDIEHWTAEFTRTGFAGGINWYRNVNTNWELLAPWVGARVNVPALYMVGDRDDVYRVPGLKEFAERLREYVPRLTRTVVLEGCGHWTQQESPREVNDALLEFLRQI
jgi:epoxide hydrolase A/B